MVRHTTTLAVLVAALSSAACSVHISTGPSTPLYTSAPAQPNGVVWASAPRPHREHREHREYRDTPPRQVGDREAPRNERPNRQFDAADQYNADVAAGRTPRQLEPTKDGGVATVGTPSHTGKTPRNFEHWGNKPTNSYRPADGPAVAGGNSDGKTPPAARTTFPRGDGRLQQVAKQER